MWLFILSGSHTLLVSRTVTTRYWDGEKFVEVEASSDLDALKLVSQKDQIKEESEKILSKLGEDDPRVNPRAALQGAPRGLKYRKKYVQALQSQEKIEERFSIEKIEKILSEMVISQQQNQQSKETDGINDEVRKIIFFRYVCVCLEGWYFVGVFCSKICCYCI